VIDERSAPPQAGEGTTRQVGESDPRVIEARLREILDRVRAAEVRNEAAQSPAPAVEPSSVRKDHWLRTPDPNRRWSPLGQMLIARHLVTAEQLESALTTQRSTGRRLGETLVEMGAISGVDLSSVLADHLSVPFVDLRHRKPDPMLASLISPDIARRYSALPFARWSGELVVAMANPNDVFALDDLRVLTRQSIIAALADADQLNAAIDACYTSSNVETTIDDASSDYDSAPEDLAATANEDADGPVVRLVDALIEEAARERASDLHIEPTSTHITIRMRIDGVLQDVSEAPLSVLRPLLSRIKVLGAMDIAQTRQPQDGRFSAKTQGRAIDVRVATIPTAAGEAVVLRLLDAGRGLINVAELGLGQSDLDRLAPCFSAPQGAIFVSGPTGSGKTSTLYAMLSSTHSRAKSVVSVEDPIEYRLDGIRQIPINPRAGVTFPSALRAILRADPDVIFVGEVRDGETARIAADASITGHLVVSTVHTTSAAAVPIRLIDMGVEPYLVASALTCVLAQRLVRRLCPHCARAVPRYEGQTSLRELGASESIVDTANVRAAVGCSECSQTGYRGRRAIYEVMPVSRALGRLIVQQRPVEDIEALAVSEGMSTLRTSALRSVAAGDLSIDELIRVIV
jgi:type IV pilus assembly protein PilB